MRFKSILLTASVLFVLASCSKDDDPPASSYPKNVSVEYRVSSPSGIITAAQVVYRNESGSLTGLSNVSLPFSKKISITVNQYDNISVAVTHAGSGTMKLKILVDNVSVKSQEFTDNTVIAGSLPYVFP